MIHPGTRIENPAWHGRPARGSHGRLAHASPAAATLCGFHGRDARGTHGQDARATTRRSGFTLLEMLAAMTMVAVLAGSLYASLSIAFRARNSALRSLEPVRKCATAIAMLRADLQSAAGPKGLLAGPMLGEMQTGTGGLEGDALEFYAAIGDAQDGAVGGDIRKVEISCEPATDSRDNILYRRLTCNLLASRTSEPTEEVLCRGVRSFTLRYYDGTTWYDSWDSTAQGDLLPVAVEVALELVNPDTTRRDQAGYRMASIVLIPCGQPYTEDTASGDGTMIQLP